MTTGTPRELPAELRTWALAQLQLDPAATVQDVRGSVLQRLAEEDFLPPWRWQQAFALLHRPGRASAERVLAHGQLPLDEEERLRDAIGAFAGEFFDLPCDERRRRWLVLNEQCPSHLALMAWLHELEPGLCVTVVTQVDCLDSTDARVSQLAEHLRSLFVLRRGPRCRRRQALFLKMKNESAAWEPAIRELQRLQPALAVLESNLLEGLIIWRQYMAESQRTASWQLDIAALWSIGQPASSIWVGETLSASFVTVGSGADQAEAPAEAAADEAEAPAWDFPSARQPTPSWVAWTLSSLVALLLIYFTAHSNISSARNSSRRSPIPAALSTARNERYRDSDASPTPPSDRQPSPQPSDPTRP